MQVKRAFSGRYAPWIVVLILVDFAFFVRTTEAFATSPQAHPCRSALHLRRPSPASTNRCFKEPPRPSWWTAREQRQGDIASISQRRRSTATYFSLNPTEVAGGAPAIFLRDVVQSLFQYYGPIPFAPALGINVVLFTALRRKLLSALTPAGFLHSMALGTGLWTTLGWRGWTYCVLYLVLGQLVTKVKFQDKQDRGLAEGRGGRRGPENVWGSAATSLLCAVASVQAAASPTCEFLGVSSNLFVLGFVAALATKLADTFASEIGKAYGKTTFLITSLERVEPGTEGAVSAEGTAAAALGGFLLSLYGAFVGLIEGWPMIAVSAVAAFLATNAESLIGATLQDREGFDFMTNEVVNFINTLIGGALAIFAGKIFLGM